MSKIDLSRSYKTSPSVAESLLKHFGGNSYHARAREVQGEVTYAPVRQPLTEELILEHLAGNITLGSYQLLEADSKVNWIGWDVDSNDLNIARSYTKQLLGKIASLPHAVEFSGGKGYHILVFLSEPMDAQKAKNVVDYVRDSEGLPKSGKSHVEAFPKQGKLTKTQTMGSLMKLPLGKHPRTHEVSRFVDPANGWEVGEALPPEEVLSQTATPEQVLALLHTDRDVKQQIVDLLIPLWSTIPGEHHNFCLYLAGYLAHLGWGLEDAKWVVSEIVNAVGDEEPKNRLQTVVDTFRSVSEGKAVKGYRGLFDLLPGNTIKVLTQLATKVIASSTVQQMDSVRLQKGAGFEKVRTAANLIWADLRENGDILQTADNSAYWYDGESHELVPFISVLWEAELHKRYGINTAESFGRQVTNELRMKAVNDARIVKVHNRTLWDGETLFVHLGGPEVYMLNGKDIEQSYNGDCGYMFKTSPAEEVVVPNMDDPLDAWELLVKDINFSQTQDAPATPEEQGELLKAWILGFFFQELFHTRPLLLALGVPGSGKTSAMRRILKVLESPSAEVLEVVRDKPDSLRASLDAHRMLVLDNLEKSGVAWLVDTLNRLATGASIELRQLYKTNEVYTLRPNIFLAMTAVSMPFSDEALFSRILPLELQRINSPIPEHRIQRNIASNVDRIWGDLLLKLNVVVKALRKKNVKKFDLGSNRLADFAEFCFRISESSAVSAEPLLAGLRSLSEKQSSALRNASPFVVVLEEWAAEQPEEAQEWYTFKQLYSILYPLARARKLAWRWSAPSALARHVLALQESLEKEYGMESKEEYNEELRRDAWMVRFRTLGA